MLPLLVAARLPRSRPKTRWDIWLTLNAGLVVLGVGIPLVNGTLMIAGGTLVFIAAVLLLKQLVDLRPLEAGAPLLGTAEARRFYIASLSYLLLGIFVGTGLFVGWDVVHSIADILHFPRLFGTISPPVILPKETSPMSAIALVTDSTANLPEELLKLYNVTVVPLYVRFGDTVQKDYVELPPAQFYKRLSEVKAAGGELPKTSQPTPADFEACYRAIARNGAEEILSVHVAAKMSGTLNSAQVAGEMVRELVQVRAVDSTTIAMQMSYMLIEAAEAIRRGGGIQEAVDAAERVKANSCTYFTVTQVEHIEASGRVAGADKVAEAEIAVRPVIGIFDGQAKVVSAERTQRAATEKVVELTRQRLKGLTIKGVSVVHTNAPDRAEALKAAVPAELGYHGQVYVAEMGPVLAVHVGPGVVGLAAYGE